MKTSEELNALKENLEALSAKLQELTPEEIEKVTGGLKIDLKTEAQMKEEEERKRLLKDLQDVKAKAEDFGA